MYRMPPKSIFLPQSHSAKKMTQTLLFHPPSPFPSNFLQLQQWWHLHCFAILGSTFTVIHSVKQRILRNWPGSDAATSHDVSRERLQRVFTHANQLHRTAQYKSNQCQQHKRCGLTYKRHNHLKANLSLSPQSSSHLYFLPHILIQRRGCRCVLHGHDQTVARGQGAVSR